MSSDLRSVTIRLSPPTYEKISMLAESRGETISETIRYLIKRGLEKRISDGNTKTFKYKGGTLFK